MNQANRPSPCPSPRGRGDAFSKAATGLPLPWGAWGEGQGEGRFPQFIMQLGLNSSAAVIPETPTALSGIIANAGAL
jgi:hypothetical protein